MRSEPNTPVGKWCDMCKRSGHYGRRKRAKHEAQEEIFVRGIFVVIITGRKAIRGKTILNQRVV